AVFRPVPTSPTIRSAGMVQSLKWISRVGDPLIPSLRSFGPTENPGSSACTTHAEMPSVGLAASGSVTAITVYQLDAPALVIQVFVPLSTHESFCHRARLRIEAVSLPASRSDNAYEIIVSPEA